MDGVQWSRDSKWIAWFDNENRLRAMDVASRRLVEIDQTGTGALNDFSWSADGKWIAYVKNGQNAMSSIWLYSFDTGRKTQVTDGMTDEGSPAFDPKGRFLYFVSARDFNFSFGGGSTFRSRIYAATLQAGFGHPFPPLSDEEPAVVGEKAEADSAKDVSTMTIDLDGLGDRVMPLPGLDPGSYGGLIPTDDGLLYSSGGALHQYSLEDRESKEIIPRIQGFAITPDRKKLVYRAGDPTTGSWTSGPGRRPRTVAWTWRGWPSISIPRSNGPRSTTTPGSSCGTGSTIRECTAWTGRQCTGATSP
jgi:tricorn protease